mgnify:CR=1 FL=1
MREIRLVLMVHASIMRDVSNVEVGHYLLTYLLTYSHYDLLLATHGSLLTSHLSALSSHLSPLTSYISQLLASQVGHKATGLGGVVGNKVRSVRSVAPRGYLSTHARPR